MDHGLIKLIRLRKELAIIITLKVATRFVFVVIKEEIIKLVNNLIDSDGTQ